MRHGHHYSVDEANALCRRVAHQGGQIRETVQCLQRAAACAALTRAAEAGGGGYPGREVAADAVDVYIRTQRLDCMDVIVRDLDRGLVDFPALSDGQEAYLCWTVDEPSVAHWHELDAGAAGRNAL